MSAIDRYAPVPPECDEERRLAILADVPAMRMERYRLKLAIDRSIDPESIAIWLRRIDKIEERFCEAGLADDGLERVL